MEVVKEQGHYYAYTSQRHQYQYGLNFLKPYLKPGLAALDVGCGVGDVCNHILNAVGTDGYVLGIDPDSARIKIAQEKFSHHPNIAFIDCKGSEIPVAGNEQRFDLVFSNSAFHWMDAEEKGRSLKNIFAVLKPKGLLLLQCIESVPKLLMDVTCFIGKEETGVLNDMTFLLSREEILRLIEKTGFQVCSSESYDFKSIWDDLDQLTEFYTGCLNGRVNYNKAVEKVENELNGKVPPSWLTDGTYLHTTNLVKCVFQKP